MWRTCMEWKIVIGGDRGSLKCHTRSDDWWLFFIVTEKMGSKQSDQNNRNKFHLIEQPTADLQIRAMGRRFFCGLHRDTISSKRHKTTTKNTDKHTLSISTIAPVPLAFNTSALSKLRCQGLINWQITNDTRYVCSLWCQVVIIGFFYH